MIIRTMKHKFVAKEKGERKGLRLTYKQHFTIEKQKYRITIENIRHWHSILQILDLDLLHSVYILQRARYDDFGLILNFLH